MPEVDVEIGRRTRKSRQNQDKFPEKLPQDWLMPMTLTGNVTVLEPSLPSLVASRKTRECWREMMARFWRQEAASGKEDAELAGVTLGDSLGSRDDTGRHRPSRESMTCRIFPRAITEFMETAAKPQ
jgi:hypothetical protein